MSVEEQISQLVHKYEGLNARRLKQFNEENTKKDFILPLFRHLGWDVSNSDEVAAEEKSSNGRVDYAFKIGGVSKFYLEAKPLREDLNQRPDWAKQVITYAENKGVTWAVLTNFKQLMVFNAEWDKPALERARFLNLTYQEYLPAFHKLWWLSRDSLEKGTLDEEARQVGALKPKLPVEKSLLDQLLRWRGELFNQIYQHNKDRGLDFLQVDELIQQFINRLIFIRSTEDRGIEGNRLRATLHQWRDSEPKGELVERMRAIFHEFATLYDSDLFPLLDTWDSVFVDSVTIEEIIEGSYERPKRLAGYDFAAIDPDVLGAVYEQYLGYVAQVAKEEAKKGATQARLLGLEAPTFELEARQIKRKQQGIYYTPKFVTDYIVKETVGRFIKEHSYNDIFNIKILDPACGSGSFLIRAYDELLHYHARQQGKSPAELDHWERRRILLGNIFGVDLDRQAVEITRLSLLLSCVAQREILPSLAGNIRQGNSLISGTEEELKKYFGDSWEEKKPFNWEWKFPDIMKDGGFDVVIGNPPYIDSEIMTKTQPELREFCRTTYESAKGNWDMFCLFLECGLTLLKKGGYLGMIVPNKLLSANYCETIRKIIQRNEIKALRDYSKVPVFGSSVYPVIIIVQKRTPTDNNFLVEVIESENEELKVAYSKEIRQKLLEKIPTWSPVLYAFGLTIVDQIMKQSMKLREVTEVYGASTVSEAYKIKDFLKELTNERNYFKFINTGTIDRYRSLWGIVPAHYLHSKLDRPIVLRVNLKSFSQRRYQQSSKAKIIIAGMSKFLECYLDEGEYLAGKSTIVVFSEKMSLKFLLAVLNSKLLTFCYKNLFKSLSLSGGYMRIGAPQIANLPIKVPADTQQKEIGKLVDRMLELNKRLAPIRNTPSTEHKELLREIKRTDAEIDQKVYELYGLTEEERQVIEASL